MVLENVGESSEVGPESRRQDELGFAALRTAGCSRWEGNDTDGGGGGGCSCIRIDRVGGSALNDGI